VFLLQGIAAIILGLTFLSAPGETLLMTVTFLGIYWPITGVLAPVRMFTDRLVPWVWSLLVGIVGGLAGIFGETDRKSMRAIRDGLVQLRRYIHALC
jgi:uncharacterized membrane protein HdeD (DUF308 family)